MTAEKNIAFIHYNKQVNSISPGIPMTVYACLISCISVSRYEIIVVIVQVQLEKVSSPIPAKVANG